MMTKLNISLLQMDLSWEKPVKNREKAEAMLRKIPSRTNLVVLPEMFTTGFTMDAVNNAETAPSTTLEWMKTIAKNHDLAITGSIIFQENNQFFNRLYFVTPDGEHAIYDKRHLFRMAGEDDVYSAGSEVKIVEWNGWKICPMVCYDLRFPVWSRNVNMSYDLLLYVANWPAPRVSHWKQLLIARAIENQSYVAGVNRCGVDGKNIEYTGDSAIVDALGNLLTQNVNEESVLSASLDFEELKRYRDKFPAWKDADDFRII